MRRAALEMNSLGKRIAFGIESYQNRKQPTLAEGRWRDTVHVDERQGDEGRAV